MSIILFCIFEKYPVILLSNVCPVCRPMYFFLINGGTSYEDSFTIYWNFEKKAFLRLHSLLFQ